MARPRSTAAQQRITEAATALIAESGVEGFTIDAVAKRSGVAKTTIYRHFGSTNELLIDTCSSRVEQFPTPNTGSLRDDLLILYKAWMPIMDEPSMRRMMLGIMARASADEDFHKLKEAMVHERHQPVRTVIELAMARGEVRSELDLDIAVDMVEGPFISRSLMHGQPVTLAHAELIIDSLLDGIRA